MEARTQLVNDEQRGRLTKLFRAYAYIIAVYQFGSTAHGRAGPLSDLDIALLFNEAGPSGVTLARLEGILAHRIRRLLNGQFRDIDVISLNRCPPVFQHSVLRSGRLVYDADPAARRLYEWKVIQAYLSFEPTLRWMSPFQKEGWLRRCGLR